MIFNQNLYIASREVLIEKGAPWDKAEAASRVIGKDDGAQPNFGRTPQDQEAIEAVMPYLQGDSNGK